jgi:hypothetical protein
MLKRHISIEVFVTETITSLKWNLFSFFFGCYQHYERKTTCLYIRQRGRETMFRLIPIDFSQKSPHFSLLSPTSPCELSEREVSSLSNLKVVGALDNYSLVFAIFINFFGQLKDWVRQVLFLATKYSHKTKARVARTPQKTRGWTQVLRKGISRQTFMVRYIRLEIHFSSLYFENYENWNTILTWLLLCVC